MDKSKCCGWCNHIELGKPFTCKNSTCSCHTMSDINNLRLDHYGAMDDWEKQWQDDKRIQGVFYDENKSLYGSENYVKDFIRNLLLEADMRCESVLENMKNIYNDDTELAVQEALSSQKSSLHREMCKSLEDLRLNETLEMFSMHNVAVDRAKSVANKVLGGGE